MFCTISVSSCYDVVYMPKLKNIEKVKKKKRSKIHILYDYLLLFPLKRVN